MKRTIKLDDHGTGFTGVLKDALEELGFECSLDDRKIVIESAPLLQEVPKQEIMKVVKAYEDLYYSLVVADLATSPDPATDELLKEKGMSEVREFAEAVKHNPKILFGAVRSGNDIPASVVEAIYRFLIECNMDELKAELVAYMGGT